MSVISRSYILVVIWASLLATFLANPQRAKAQTVTVTTLGVSSGGSSVSTVAHGSAVTLTAGVTAGGVAVTGGQVNFCDAAAVTCSDIHLLGTAVLTSAGTAAVTLQPGIGSHSYQAVFAGTGSEPGSRSSAAGLTVSGLYATAAALAQSGSAGVYTLTATVTGQPGAGITAVPSGTVSFVDNSSGGTVLGTGTLAAGSSGWSFVNPQTPAVGSLPVAVVAGDFNGDGKPDLAVANQGSGTLTVLLGAGDGTFTAAAVSPVTGSSPSALALGDFNGDGKLDVAVANQGSGTLTVLLGNGDGTFTAAVSPATGSSPGALAVGDFNGDGKLDLAVANQGSNSVSVLLGNGDGTFTAAAVSPATGSSPGALAAGDFNGDGMLDLAVANQGSNSVSVLLGNGDGTFTAAAVSPATGSSPSALAAGDFNSDGKLDVAVANQGSGTLTVLLGNGDGTFTAAAVSPVTGSSPGGLALGDFNGDGMLDLAVANQASGTLTVLLGAGDGTFTAAAVSPAAGSSPGGLAAGDFNGDGTWDLGVVNPGSSTLTVLLAEQLATATAVVSGLTPPGPGVQQVAASYAGDSNYAASVSTSAGLSTTAVATALTLSASPASSRSGQAVTLTAALSPYAAGGYSTGGETVTFKNGAAVLGTGTLSGGVATLTLTALPVGTDSLSAVFGGDANFNGSTSNSLPYPVTPVTVTTLGVSSGGSSVSTVAHGSAVTLTAGVTAGGVAVTGGQVNFCDAAAVTCSDIHLLGTAVLTSAGTAAVTLQPGIGSHSYQAVFAGTGSEPGSRSSAAGLTVSGLYATAAALAQSGSAGVYTLTATVTGQPGAGITAVPSGTVSFVDNSSGGTVLGTGTLAAGSSGWSFVNPQTPAVGSLPVAVVAGDFNGDGKPDLAVANQGSGTLTVLLGAGDGTFTAAAVSPVTGSSPSALALGDFNGDGKLDVAVANQGSGTLTVLLGNGDGTFTAAVSPATGSSPGALAVGDFNGDGKLDLAVANQGSNSVSVLLGNGDGTFTAAAVSPATGSSPGALAAGDFNGDGMLDLAVANQGSNSVSVLLGNGDGTFTAAAVSPATGSSPSALAAGDFNSDGKLDVAVANQGSGTLTVLLGNGDGTFTAAAVSPVTGSSPGGLALGDFNGDGMLDLAVANQASGTLTVLLGAGDGTFTAAAVSPAAGSSPGGLAAGDFNGDGTWDLGVVNPGSSTLTVLLAEQLATATAVVSGLTPPGPGVQQVAASYAGDSNYAASVSTSAGLSTTAVATALTLSASPASSRSGQAVTLTAALSPYAAGGYSTGGETVTFKNGAAVLGTGTLSGGVATLTLTALPVGTDSLSAVFGGDANFNGSTSNSLPYPVTPVTVTTLGVSSGGSSVSTVAHGSAVTLTAGVTAGGVAVTGGQVNFCDAAAVTCSDIHLLGTAVLTSAGTAAVTLQPGIGSHSYQAVFAGTGSEPGSRSSAAGLTVSGLYATAAALAQSGSAGVYTLTATVTGQPGAGITAVPSGTVSFVDNSSGGTVLGTGTLAAGSSGWSFVNPQTPAVGSLPVAVVAGDFNGDGKPDLAVANQGSGTLTVLLGAGDGTFTAAAVSPVTGSSPSALALGDFNGDGKLDVAVANQGSGTLTVLLGNGDGTFTAAVSPATGSSPGALAVGDFNGDGKLDLAVANQGSNSVSVLLGNGDGTFTAAAVSPATGSSPGALAAGDFNGDGMLDLAVANQGSNSVSVLLGNGDGTFTAAAVSPATGSSPSALAAGDFNSDGKLDVAVANQGSNSVSVLLGNGDGTFTAAAVSPVTGSSPKAVIVGDLNGDLKADLIVANSGSNTMSALLGNGDGTFTATAHPSTGYAPSSLAVADFDGDSLSDIAVANSSGFSVTVQLSKWTIASLASSSGLSPVGVGVHQVAANYAGDKYFAASISSPISLSVLPVALLSANAVAFGNGSLGVQSAVQIVTLTNPSNQPLTISSIGLTGVSSSSFLTSNNCGATIAAGASCSIRLRLCPQTSGLLYAALDITDNAANSPQNIALTGSNTSSAVMLSAIGLAFGNEYLGAQSAAQTVTLSNTGKGALTIGGIAVTGGTPSPFPVSSNCGTTVAGGASCVISLRFAPQAAGTLAAALSITDSDPTSPQTIPLTGNGVGPIAALSATAVALGNGSTGAQTVTLINAGNWPLSISSLALTGTTPTSFTSSSNCGSTVAAGGSCSFQLTLTPKVTGALSANLVLTDNAPGSPQIVSLTGTNTAPALSLSVTSVLFGPESLNIKSAPQTLTLTNTGSSPLTMGAISLTGSNTTSFLTSNTCGTAVAAGASCALSAYFLPQTAGLLTAAISINYSGAGSPQTVFLSGTGTSGPITTLSTNSVVFTSASPGMQSSAQTVVLTNSGAATLGISNISLSGPNASSFVSSNTCGTTVAAGASCTVSVSLAPGATGALSASLLITDSSASAPYSVQLSAAGVSLNPQALYFGGCATGTACASQNVILSNNGTKPLTISSIGLAGLNPTAFSSSNNCPTVLAVAGGCSISVSFQPTASGLVTAAVNVLDDASSSPQAISISGVGTSGVPVIVVVYGASPAGVMAAVEAAKLGKNVVLLEPTQHIGGLMANGLGDTDIYGTQPIGGLPLQFFQNIVATYGGNPSVTTFNFVPHMAEQTFNSMLSLYPNISLVLGASLSSVQMTGTVITSILASNGTQYQGKEYIDASYTGDLMAAANVSFTVGREAAAQYNESFGGVGTPSHMGFSAVDPYVVPGNSSSGLIAHVFSDKLGVPGSADAALMAYNYRLCLSADPTNQIPIKAPANYSPLEFELLGRLAVSAQPPSQIGDFIALATLQNSKFDLNNSGPMSTDEVEENYKYPTASASVRFQIEQEQKRYIQAYLYFLSTDSRIPQGVQSLVKTLGYCKDEFTDNGGWPHQIYVRESRRMIGAYVMTQSDISSQTNIPDVVGLGGYPMDDHLNHVVSLNGSVQFEVESGLNIQNPYPIPYRALIPQASQVSNLLVPVDVSASHVAYDSLRVEPTYMIMGQAAGAAASLAIDESSTLQNLNYSALANQLLADGAVLTAVSNSPLGPPGVVSISPSSGTGAQTFTAVYTDPNGTSDLTAVRLLFNTAVTGVNACYLIYYPASNTIYLENNADNATIGPLTPGSSSVLSNSQCTLAGAGTSVTSAGNNMTVNFALTFANTFSGLKNTYLASDNSTTSSGWLQKGTWTTASLGPPTNISLTPASGTGLTQTFTAVYSDPNGSADVTAIRLLFNTAITGVNACYVIYYPASNALYLQNNANNGPIGPLTPGSSFSIANNQCTLAGTGTSFATSGNTLTVKLALTFTNSFAGSKNAYLASDNATSSGWVQMGTWTPISLGPPGIVSLSPTSGTGLNQTFSAVYSDPNGTSDLTAVRLLLNTAISGANACYVIYYPSSNALYLVNNANNGTTGPLTPGSSSSLSNSQCTLSGAGTSVSTAGNNMAVRFVLTFSSTFTGSKNSYLASDNASSSGWVQEGTWTPVSVGPPADVSLSPTSGIGLTQTFTAVYSDPNGISDLTAVRLLFNTAVTGVNACYLIYYPASNAVYLENNANNGTIGPLTPGSSASISNSQCTLAGTGTSVSVAGNNMTVQFALTFGNSFTGTKNAYLASDNATSSGWSQMGTWTTALLSPASGTGLSQTFSAIYSDPNGTNDLTAVRILFNTAISGLNACYVIYYPASNAMYLKNNSNNGTVGPLTPGSSSSLSNSQCTLAGTGTSVSTSGTNMTVNFALTFASSFTGSQNTYLAWDNATASSGWAQRGIWTPVSLGSPGIVSLSPSSGAGLTQTFTAVYSDPNGSSDLTAVRLLINTAITGVNACYVIYYPASNAFYLQNDANNATVGPLTPGSLSSISNSQCTLSGAGSTVSSSGSNMSVTFPLTFSNSFAGSKNAYLASDNALSSGWVQMGSWTP